NTALYGGGLSGYGTYTLTQSAVISDNAGFQGGGAYIFGGGRLVMMNESIVSNNVSSGGPLGSSQGGGIANQGTVSLKHGAIYGNQAVNGPGGGLYNAAGGTATLDDALLLDNQAGQGSGGGLANLGAVTITASAIISNVSLFSGGGISNTGSLSIANTTFSGNSAADSGALFNNGAASLNYVTIASNFSEDGAGGLASTGALSLTNTLLGDNGGGDFNDCAGTLTSLGHNLIEDMAGCTLAGPGGGDKLGVDPLLGPLQIQGGALSFHDLLDHSPAIDSADPAACLPTDQRGVARPIWVLCDIGAIETSSRPFLLFLPLVRR
ncbi:MAG: choice-of-anchor Q domain-containing protein, partial [Anaerolineales bacterium]